jgi:hypothetical protein
MNSKQVVLAGKSISDNPSEYSETMPSPDAYVWLAYVLRQKLYAYAFVSPFK